MLYIPINWLNSLIALISILCEDHRISHLILSRNLINDFDLNVVTGFSPAERILPRPLISASHRISKYRRYMFAVTNLVFIAAYRWRVDRNDTCRTEVGPLGTAAALMFITEQRCRVLVLKQRLNAFNCQPHNLRRVKRIYYHSWLLLIVSKVWRTDSEHVNKFTVPITEPYDPGLWLCYVSDVICHHRATGSVVTDYCSFIYCFPFIAIHVWSEIKQYRQIILF